MARAAVKAKQQARAKVAQPAKVSRRRKHAGGGNPNQQLFFMRLRRRQKWLYAFLALVFAVAFAGVGVGSGSGGLSDLYQGLFGGGGTSISKAEKEVKTNPAKGYKDLANAYLAKNDTASAITALQSYVGVKKKDAGAWSELGGLEQQQGDGYATQYQQLEQQAQNANPDQAFEPTGTLGTAFGTNPVFDTNSQNASSQMQQLGEEATGAYSQALTAYQKAAKLQPRNALAQFQVATAASRAGSSTVELKALKRYLQLDPHTPQKAEIVKAIKGLSPKKK